VADSVLDEEKDPYFLAGRNRVNGLDYAGAVESFSKALEANPRSASAHKELGLLYYQKLNDYAAAIYHFQQLLKLRPKDPQAEFIRQNIIACTQELGRSVFLDPISERHQQLLQRLTEENSRLKAEVTNLQAHVAWYRHQAALAAQAAATAQSGAAAPLSQPPSAAAPPTQPPPASLPQASAPPGSTAGGRPAAASPAPSGSSGRALPPLVTRSDRTAPTPNSRPAPTPEPFRAPPSRYTSHRVQSGENPSSIARKYGVSLNALLAANPGLDPHRLRAGQVLNIPRR
jgi:hypothetical protein